MKKLLLSALSLFVCVLAMGEPVSSKQALEIAANYLAKSGAPRRAAAQMSVQPFQTDRQGNPLMYAVNNGGDGYVIVSGDDRARCWPTAAAARWTLPTCLPTCATGWRVSVPTCSGS